MTLGLAGYAQKKDMTQRHVTMSVDTPVAPSVNERKQRTLMMHPLTQEVFIIPDRALLHDYKDPVYMEYDTFEKMSATGQLSGERMLHRENSHTCSFKASQVVAVRLKQHGASTGGQPIYAWGSRMTTTICVPDVDTVVGQEFLWLWPPGKAHNAYHTRHDRLQNNPDHQPLGIDEIEPTCRYTLMVPGSMLGPDDIEGSVRVPTEELSPEQRFFVMCIKPQQTLFPRRSHMDQWTQRVSDVIDKNQMAARQGGKWTLHNSVQSLLEKRRSLTDETKRSRDDTHDAPYRKVRVVLGDRTFTSTRQEASKRLESRSKNSFSDAEAHIQRKRRSNKCKRQDDQSARWGELPDDILMRILCVRIGDALAGPDVKEAHACVLTMRCVSRDTLALVESFVGAQISSILVATQQCLIANAPHISIPDVSARVRALGIGMVDAVRLTEHKMKIRNIRSMLPGWSLAKSPTIVPDWRWYLELRYATSERHGAKTVVAKPQSLPSKLYHDLMKEHRAREPHIWASRFTASDDVFSSGFDHMITEAGEVDVRDHMNSVAGICG